MYEPTMTLEERERLHYITNSSMHGVIAHALDGDEDLQADLQRAEEERKEQEERGDAEYDRAEKAEDRAADLESALDDAKQHISDLQRTIHDNSLDLV